MVKMEDITNNDAIELKKVYYDENMTDNIIYYKDLNFSMNKGDYMEPII